MANINKVDALQDLIPSHFKARTNPNWKALLDAIGSEDQDTADLIAQVRQQFFVKTASRPYIDRLAANNKISRPRFVGMDDPSFRQYIPILSYSPKQVKLIIDQLLDVFFFKESTTAFMTSQAAEPFALQDGWELQYSVDELNDERIQFAATDFTDITKATANEVASAINRQTKYSYATAEYNSITKSTYIRVFTNTIGSKGSLRLEGGRANVALEFDGFNFDAGNGTNTQWTVTKIGDEVTFQYSLGQNPGISFLQIGDIAIINLAGNVGSFAITNVDLTNQSFTFINLFATVGTFSQTDATQLKFLRPQKFVAYLNPRRAMVWETTSGEITVEMPTSPPVVKRSLKGSAHINGAFSKMANRDSNTSCTVEDATQFPNSGNFWLQEVEQRNTHMLTPFENATVQVTNNTRLIGAPQKYSYTSRTALATTGDIVAGTTQIINLASVVGLAAGQQVTMDGVPPYALVTSVVGNIANIDKPATINATGTAVSFLGNQLTGISPNLPTTAGLNEFTNSSLTRAANVVTVTTSIPHNFVVGDPVIINTSGGILSLSTNGNTVSGSNQITSLASVVGLAPGMLVAAGGVPSGSQIIAISGTTVTLNQNAFATNTGFPVNFSENVNGGFIIQSTTSNTFTYNLVGNAGSASNPGISTVERAGMASSGSILYITDAILNSVSRVIGPYIWDPAAPFTLSSDTGTIADTIQAGKIIRLLNLNSNTIPATGGFIIFDYGLETQEGPVRYLYKPTANTIAIDPSYTFQHNHAASSGITLVGSSGPHPMSGVGSEYAPYITDPSGARLILEDLIRSVKSSGIFVNFLVHYPDQLYATLDVYVSGVDPG